MIRVNIPGISKPLEVTVYHDRPGTYARRTHVSVSLPGYFAFTAASRCSPGDQFCKRTGRKIAANRLLASLRMAHIPYDVRQAVFYAICPEFRPVDKTVDAPLEKYPSDIQEVANDFNRKYGHSLDWDGEDRRTTAFGRRTNSDRRVMHRPGGVEFPQMRRKNVRRKANRRSVQIGNPVQK